MEHATSKSTYAALARRDAATRKDNKRRCEEIKALREQIGEMESKLKRLKQEAQDDDPPPPLSAMDRASAALPAFEAEKFSKPLVAASSAAAAAAFEPPYDAFGAFEHPLVVEPEDLPSDDQRQPVVVGDSDEGLTEGELGCRARAARTIDLT